MKLVIIEDEPLTARDLVRTVRGIDPDIEILPILYSLADATSFFDQSPEVDLIFSDIELGDGTSFDLFGQLSLKIPIVFCTAYDGYTLKAFENFGIDYIIKPFQKKQIEKALQKYKDLKYSLADTKNRWGKISNHLTELIRPGSQSLLVHKGDRIIPIAQEHIALFHISKEKVFVFTHNQERYAIPDKMDALELRFPHFFRANRQCLLNRNSIKEAAAYFNRKLLVTLHFKFPEPIIVSRLKVNQFLEWLAKEPI